MDLNVTISAEIEKQDRRKPRLAGQEEFMRRTLLAVLILVSAASAAWTEEREALRVEYENGEPGEAAVHWVQTFFVDGSGTLTRIERKTDAEYGGEPTRTTSSTLTWSDHGISWSGSLWSGRLEQVGDDIVVTSGRDASGYKISITDRTATWTTDGFLGRWSEDSGLDLRLVTDPPPPADPFSGVSTKGSRISRWDGGLEVQRILFGRGPSRLEGIYVAPLESGTGWFSTGYISYQGMGLWSKDSATRARLFALLDSSGFPPGWQSFVLVQKFLR